MLRSMTGYGRGEASSGEVTVVVELRSVNNRFRDFQIRCPRVYLPLEPRVNNVLKEPFSRGRIDAFVHRSVTASRSQVIADADLAKEYLSAARSVASRLGELADDVPLTWLLSQPGVLNVEEGKIDVMTEWDVVDTALASAIADLQQMREAEGRALYQDLQHHLAELRAVITEVEMASTGLAERLRQKLEGRIRRMITDRFDASRMEQEVALLVDKADVAEELARLRSHVDQFADALEDGEPVGRRLDFLLQEMNREVNTLGSKAAEHPVSHRVVTMKSILEKMREQAANVE